MAFEAKYEYKIEIDTMEDAKKFVAIAGKLQGKIVLRSGSKFSVNAKVTLYPPPLSFAKYLTF